MNIGIVGLGLMGGSLGRTLVKKTEHRVFGTDKFPHVLDKAILMGAMHEQLTKTNAGLIDMLIISVYPEGFCDVLDEYLDCLKPGAVVMDFCGIKRPIIEIMKDRANRYPHISFIGGHPMAGREFSGIERSVTTLFDKASMILINVNADIFKLSEIKAFYLNLGFVEVVLTDAENHDAMIAYTSQLCHIVSNSFIKNETARKHFGYSAGSYKDLTRVARLNPDMWTELMFENKDKLTCELEEFINNTNKYLEALKNGDREELKALLKEGNDIKLSIDTRGNK